MAVGLWPKLGEEKKQRAFVPPARREETGSESFDESKNEFEIKDPQLIFQDAWRALEQEIGFESMAMPKSVLWMAGAPGAGKGTMANFIMKESGIDEEPVEVSSLLNTPEARQMKEAGQLIGDREVAIAVLRTLCQPKYRNGIIIDGFPRTKVQAEVIALLFEKILEIRKANEKNMGVLRRFRRPIFHCAVLFVNEQVSVERQMARGKSIMNHNQRVMETGVGSIIEVRATDVDPELARKRYRVFKTEVYEALKIVKDRFAFHFIDASGSPEEVHARIVEEFEYQSSLELGEQAFEAVRMFPLAKEVVKHARSNLVRRLDGYAREQDLLLEQVMQVLDRDFKHIVERQALTGGAIIRSGDTIFNNPDAIDIALDVLTERGFTAVLDVQKDLVPDQVLPPEKPGEPQRITHRRVTTFVFHLSFPKPHIRRE